MTKTISIANQKGGVGKSTTAITMASVLKEKGFNVLLIDTDMQCNSSRTYEAKMDDTETLFDVLLIKKTIPMIEAIQHTPKGDILPSDKLLRNADEVLKKDLEKLKRKIDEIKKTGQYDYIIFDTNPTLNSLLYSVLVASDELIIPVEPDVFSIEGLVQLRETIETIQVNENKDLKVAGILLLKLNERTRLGRAVVDLLDETAKEFKTIFYSSTIRRSQAVPDSLAIRKTLLEYAPESTSALDYMDFVDEYLKNEVKNDGQSS